MEGDADNPQAGQDPPQAPSSAPADEHAGNAMPSQSAHEAHTAHAHHAPGIPDPPVALPSSAALTGPDHAADAIYGAPAMAPAREIVRKEHGDIKSGMILIDQLEAVIGKGMDGYARSDRGRVGTEWMSACRTGGDGIVIKKK